MANFTPKMLEASDINGGQRFKAGDGVTPEAINGPIEAVLNMQKNAGLSAYVHHIRLGANAGGIYRMIDVVSTYGKVVADTQGVCSMFNGKSGLPLFAVHYQHPYPGTISGLQTGVPVLRVAQGSASDKITFVSLSTSGQLEVYSDCAFVTDIVESY